MDLWEPADPAIPTDIGGQSSNFGAHQRLTDADKPPRAQCATTLGIHGTEFTLTFPPGGVPVTLGPGSEGAPPTALRALVVDDEDSVLAVLVEILRGMGHQVTGAAGGPAALELLRGEPYDVVFTDLGMPDVNGWDVAAVTKSRRPECAVVLVSGWGFQLEEDAAASRGVDRVMAKPFSFQDVDQALRGLFDPRGQRRAA